MLIHVDMLIILHRLHYIYTQYDEVVQAGAGHRFAPQTARVLRHGTANNFSGILQSASRRAQIQLLQLLLPFCAIFTNHCWIWEVF